ncbi:psbO, partial [Symbiodinium pilosum]
ETNKVFDIGKGVIEMEVNKVNQELGEIGGVFVSKQPSDTDMGAKAPRTFSGFVTCWDQGPTVNRKARAWLHYTTVLPEV